MAISQKRYVDITSGVGGQAAATARELILRIITTSKLAPVNGVLEFGSLDDVGAYFGTTATEYLYAAKYFGYISKDIVMPKKISFARYTPAATSAQIIGVGVKPKLTDFTGIDNGVLDVTYSGGFAGASGMDFTTATSLAQVASIVEGALQTEGATVNVTYGANGFVLTDSVSGAESTLAVTPAEVGDDISALLGFAASTNPVVLPGADAETPDAAMARIAGLSDNFGSFLFLPTLTTEQIGAVAAWNNSSEQNLKYMYCVPVTAANYTEIGAATSGMNGVWLQLVTDGGLEEYMPAAILAATNYNRTNAARNYMYQQFPGAVATVTTNALANQYDNALVNYYGATQTSGRQLAFLQRGVLQGNVSDAGVYANEMWMKDQFLVAFFNLLLALNKIPAGADGERIVRGAMMDTINLALRNGTILPSKEFTTTQKAYIDQLTGREDSWFDVFNNGWTLDLNTEAFVDYGGANAYKITYVLIYSKGDSIKKVEGTDVLI